MTTELTPYLEVTDVFTSALQGVPCRVVGLESGSRLLPVEGWSRCATASDRALLDECVGATLDVGCGPGRMASHLAGRGQIVLAIDIVPEAVDQARRRGVAALQRSIFEPVPGEGRWDTVLLADGNIGIGGDPRALLRRAGHVLAPGGRVVCDLEGPGTGLQRHRAHLEVEGARSRRFPWALVGVDAIRELAAEAGLRVVRTTEYEGRWFSVLHR